jgi:dienelactone hydrolase
MRFVCRRRLATFALAGAALAFCLGRAAADPVDAFRVVVEQQVKLPSALPSGNANVDQINLRYYRAAGPRSGDRLPTIIIVPPIGSSDNDPQMKQTARYFADHGVNTALMTLPYHGERWPEGKGAADPGDYFLSPDVRRVVASFKQSASDVETVITWLEQRPEVDHDRLGIIGISLGAIITHLVMGRDQRISAGVALLGGGGLLDLYRSSVFAQVERALHPAPDAQDLSPDEIRAAVGQIDPLTYADVNRPRRVLMVAAARDIVIPPRSATRLWKALGEPPIQWVDANHFAMGLAAPSAMRTSLTYLQTAWKSPGAPSPDGLPGIYVPTIKFGVIAQRGELGITPALQWQFHSFAQRSDHLSLAHADLGLTPRGPFLGIGVTSGAYLDVGVASRVLVGGRVETPRPYVSLHVTF